MSCTSPLWILPLALSFVAWLFILLLVRAPKSPLSDMMFGGAFASVLCAVLAWIINSLLKAFA